MNLEEALTKARKLLRLSESDNPHESANAAAKAQAILDKYEIDKTLLETEGDEEEPDDENIEDLRRAPLDERSKFNMDTWRIRLADYIATANMCRVYTHTYRSLNVKRTILVGRPSDAEKVRYLFDFFAKEVDRLCKRDGKGCGRTWRNNYRHGVVDTLYRAIKSEREETITKLKEATSSSTALVKVEDAIAKWQQRGDKVVEFMNDEMNLRKARSAPMTSNQLARRAGKIAGEEIKITKAKGALGS